MDTTISRHGGDGDGSQHRPPTSEAFDTALRGLRDELERHVRDPGLDGHIKDSVLRVVDQGRTDGLKAEQVVIAFRQLWDGRPMVFRGGTAMERDALRWRVVSALVAGYYTEPEDRPTDASAPAGRD